MALPSLDSKGRRNRRAIAFVPDMPRRPHRRETTSGTQAASAERADRRAGERRYSLDEKALAQLHRHYRIGATLYLVGVGVKRRDVEAAKAFFNQAIRHEGRPPQTITLDGYAASHRAVRELKKDGLLPERTRLRSSKYLNNLIEQDHRCIKCRTGPMLGFKSFSSAAIIIAGVELLRRIHKAQFSLSRLRLKDQAAPAIWNAVLAA